MHGESRFCTTLVWTHERVRDSDPILLRICQAPRSRSKAKMQAGNVGNTWQSFAGLPQYAGVSIGR